MITKNELLILNSLLLGVNFVFRSVEILGPAYANGQKPPFERQVLTIVGFEPHYVNNVVVREPNGTESLLPLDMVLDMVKKALTAKSHRGGIDVSVKFPQSCLAVGAPGECF